jgi:hypothetical protein
MTVITKILPFCCVNVGLMKQNKKIRIHCQLLYRSIALRCKAVTTQLAHLYRIA